MKKLAIILTAILIGYSCSEAQYKKKTAWDYDELKGKVKSVQIKSYYAIDTLGKISRGKMIDDGYGNLLINYDINGNWTEYRSFDPENKIKWFENPIYNENGEVMERFDYSIIETDCILKRKFLFTNDIYGNIIETICTNSTDSLLWKKSMKYDEEGKETEELNYATLDSVKWRLNYSYDIKTHLIKTTKYNAVGDLIETTIYVYGSNDNNIEEGNFNADGSLKTKTTLQYNEKGHKLETCRYNFEGNIENKTTYSYKYDLGDNWIMRIEYKEGLPTRITERKIEYYESPAPNILYK